MSEITRHVARRLATCAAWAIAVGGCSAPGPLPRPLLPAPTEVTVDAAPPSFDRVCSEAPAARAPSLARVALRGDGDAALCGLLAIRAGAELDDELVTEDLHRLFATQRFDDVLAAVDDDTDGSTLVFELTPRPRLAAIEITGSSAAQLLLDDGALGDRPERVDHDWARRAEARLLEGLGELGFTQATVERALRPSAEGVVLSWVVNQGLRRVLRTLRVEGARAVPASTLESAMQLHEGDALYPAVGEQARRTVLSVLYDEGFVEAEVELDRSEDTATGQVDLVVRVSEGRRHRLGKLDLSGSARLPSARYAKLLAPLRVGQTYRHSAVGRAVAAIEQLHDSEGAPARVEVATSIANGAVDLELRVEPH